jgi:Rrf2 family cysteine metabolism transcriptional repressor
MKLSTKARYVTRALLDLACHREGEVIPLKDIARRQGISLPYLEHLMAPLVVAGLVRSLRGAAGGIRLAQSPRDIKLIKVISLVEGSLVFVECVDNPEICPRSRRCATREVWAELGRALKGVLESKTLQDLVESQQRKEQADERICENAKC